MVRLVFIYIAYEGANVYLIETRLKWVAFIGTSQQKLFTHQQNLTISVNLIFNPNHKKLP